MASDDNSVIINAQGVVKWFDVRKGFGFIIGPEKQDIFAHFTVITREGFRILKEDWVVTYDALKTPGGWRATRVVLPDGVLAERPPKPVGQKKPAAPKPAPPKMAPTSPPPTNSAPNYQAPVKPDPAGSPGTIVVRPLGLGNNPAGELPPLLGPHLPGPAVSPPPPSVPPSTDAL